MKSAKAAFNQVAAIASGTVCAWMSLEAGGRIGMRMLDQACLPEQYLGLAFIPALAAAYCGARIGYHGAKALIGSRPLWV